MKKMLLLTCHTGQGHDSCARAIKEYLLIQGVECHIVDALELVSPRFSRFVSWGHSFMYRRLPGLFRRGYSYSDEHGAVLRRDALVGRLLDRGTAQLEQLIYRGGYDTVICTHLLAALMLTFADVQGVITGLVHTDYAVCPGIEHIKLDYYFVPTKALCSALVERGIPHKKIVVSGIPVEQEHLRTRSREGSKWLVGVQPGKKHLLVMCGSMGCGPVYRTVKALCRSLPENVEVTVLCGRNKRLQKRLEKRFGNSAQVYIQGYTRKVSLYMDSADLYLTKPGGISTTEAAVKKLPMLFVDAVAGCESYNKKYFLEAGCAAEANDPQALAQKSLALLRCDAELEKMRRSFPDIPNGAAVIYQTLEVRERAIV